MDQPVKALPVLQGGEPMPPLYTRWLTEWFGGPIARETKATCDDCAMLGTDLVRQPNETTRFNPLTKCCTRHPTIPNFLVGLLLADPDPALDPGRSTMRQRCERSNAVSPLGVEPTAEFSLMYDKVYKTSFGTGMAVRCPHFLEAGGGKCGIWPYRNGACSTWFCKHDRGAAGSAFWTALRDLLRTAETDLALWSALELGIDPAAMQDLLPPAETRYREDRVAVQAGLDISRGYDAARAARLWGRWNGEWEEFYRRAGALVAALSWEEVRRRCGPEFEVRARAVRALYVRLTSAQPLPTRLKFEPFLMHRGTHEAILVTTYSYNNPIRLSHDVFRLLPRFDGRLLADVLREIVTEERVRLDESLLWSLVDYNVLKPVADR